MCERAIGNIDDRNRNFILRFFVQRDHRVEVIYDDDDANHVIDGNVYVRYARLLGLLLVRSIGVKLRDIFCIWVEELWFQTKIRS